MDGKPASPFASLGTDKALLRSTRPPSPPPQMPEPVVAPLVDEPAQVPAAVSAKPAPRATPKPHQEPRRNDTTTPSNHDTVVSRHHEETVERIRRAVRVVGKEAATYRFSAEEKSRMADLIYSYKRRGIRTSENEATRIALNFIFEEYEEHGEGSILAKVLDALNR